MTGHVADGNVIHTMKTVFDFEPTKAELRALFYDEEGAERACRERSESPLDVDPLVPYLLIGRAEWDQAIEYANQLDDAELQQCILSDIAKAREGATIGETMV